MIEAVKNFMATHIEAEYGTTVSDIILLAGIALTAIACYYLAKALLNILERAVLRSPTEWDDDILNSPMLRAVSQLAPALWVSAMLPRFFAESHYGVHWVYITTRFYILWAVIRILVILISNLYSALARRDNTRIYAIKGIFQMLKLIVIGIGIIIGISILVNRTPVAILTALGASAAVLMLVFKDTILGLVASVQLSANHMLHKGDWIIVPKHDANGTVEDISLTTVKVRNWDNSVTTIPPYSLVSESFSNYEAMRTSGGRRVMRQIYIDVNTVGLCSRQQIERLADSGFIAADTVATTPTQSVNLGLFRQYLEQYLRQRPDVNSELLLMVRQLEPTNAGLPLQLYFFTRTTEWVDYERIQAEIFDYVYAIVPQFGLAIYQSPAGTDITAIAAARKTDE